MRCEEVQNYLALNAASDPEVQMAVDAHLAGCADCKTAGRLFARIDETLKAQPAWDPPRHFAQRVISQATPVVAVPPRLSRDQVLGGVALGMLTAALVWGAGYAANDLSAILKANSVAFAWTSVILSLGVSAWFTRRALR